ncbi:LysR family transcriptional regulator [Mycobacterium aquaticum]|nr:LysR family transcriptional regulator [Mycobacterium aquaticum]
MSEMESSAFVSLRQLRFWLVIIEEGSVTAAARRLSISQPALSQHLRALERQLGGPLLERLPRGVQPTPLGRSLLGDARDALAAAQRLERHARSAQALETGVLEVATLPSLVDSTLLEPLRRWHLEHTGTSIRLHEFPLGRLLDDAVAGGTADVAVSNRPNRWSGPVVHLGWEQFVVLLPPGDPAASQSGPIVLSELAERDWVLYEPANGLADFVAIACAKAGFVPRPALLTSQVQAAARLAAAGLGPALVPSHNVPPELSSAARPLDPPVIWELTAFARTTFSPIAAAFITQLRKQPWAKRPKNAIVLPGPSDHHMDSVM